MKERIKQGLNVMFGIDETRANDYNQHNAVFLGMFSNNPKSTITEEQALRIPAVYSAVDLITSTVANLPIYLYKKEADNNIVTVADNRIRLLNSEPNAFMNGYNFKKQITKDYLLYGASYTAMLGTGNRKESLHILPSKDITVEKYVKNGFVDYADIYYTNPTTEEKQKFKFRELIIPLRDSSDGILGKGVLDSGGNILNLALDEMAYSSNILENGALPMATLETDTKLTPDSAKRLKESFDSQYSGSGNAHKTLVLEDGLRYKPISLKPNELELTTSKKTTLSDIARLFNIPESMINAESNKYSSNEQNNIHFLQYCIAPILASIESALNKSMLLEEEKYNGMYFKFDTSSILQTTEEQKIRSASMGLKSGIYTINEARRKLELKDITDHDYYSRSLGDIFIDTDTGMMLIPNLGKAIDPNNLEETMLSDDEVDELQKQMDDKAKEDISNDTSDL